GEVVDRVALRLAVAEQLGADVGLGVAVPVLASLAQRHRSALLLRLPFRGLAHDTARMVPDAQGRRQAFFLQPSAAPRYSPDRAWAAAGVARDGPGEWHRYRRVRRWRFTGSSGDSRSCWPSARAAGLRRRGRGRRCPWQRVTFPSGSTSPAPRSALT